ncbi:MAG: CRISPR-associated endonuclease Cas2 [bacterium]|nr:CRISPR-associated endonuclease Cas2 [bacterium]
MIYISYDITSDKVRAKFSKFLNKFGRKLQYSFYEVRNSPRVLQNIMNEIEWTYKKKFTGADSVLIFQICEGDKKKIVRYGYVAQEVQDVVVFL